ncbi:MAG: lysophospholipid acyltransferase family protein [Microbacteriaceae bacterium]|nr:lysophospholipid acyltransferase family protein [Microbacteriaceae bacterium]
MTEAVKTVETVKLRARTSPEKRKPSFFWVVVPIVVPSWSLFARYRITAETELPVTGPFILSPNHISEVDPLATAVGVWKLGRLPRFMAKASLFRVPVLGWVMRGTGQIPVNRPKKRANKEVETGESSETGEVAVVANSETGPAANEQQSVKGAKKEARKEAKAGRKKRSMTKRLAKRARRLREKFKRRDPLGAAEQLIAKQGGVIVYPEGTLTRDPDLWPMRGKTGAVKLALESGIPLYPMAHWGVQKIMPRYGKINFWGRKTLKIAIGEPLDLSRFSGKTITRELLNEATEQLMSEITRLLEGLRGEKAPGERWNPNAHNQSEVGRFA